MSDPHLDETERSHLETLEAVPGDREAFEALEALYRTQERFDELLGLYERRARLLGGAEASALLEQAVALARGPLADLSRAEALCRRILDGEPRHPGALRALCEIREARGDLPGLAEALEEEADRTEDRRAAAARYLALGKVHEERLSRRDRASLFYQRACRLDPSLDEARQRALECTVVLRRFAQAKRLLDESLGRGAGGAALAAQYARLGGILAGEPLEHGLAIEALVEALALDRRVPGASEALAQLKAVPRVWREEAQGLAEEAQRTREHPEAARLWLRAAALHLAYDSEPASRVPELVDRAWHAAPGMPEALALLWRLRGEREDWRALEADLSRLSEATRDRAALTALSLETALLQIVRFGDAGKAVAALERALELDPASETAAVQAFELHVDAGRVGEALWALERHLQAAPPKAGHAPLQLRAAEMALSRLDDAARARRHLESALRTSPGFAPAAAALAPLLEAAGEWRRLAEVLEVQAGAAAEPSERARFLEAAAEVHSARLEAPREAARLLLRALQLDPRRASTRQALEAAAEKAGAFREVVRAYRAAAEAVGDDPRTRKALLRRAAEILERDLSQPEEALRAWEALLAQDPDDRGAREALDSARGRAGRSEEAAEEIGRRLATARGAERRRLGAQLARLHFESGEVEQAVTAWREVLAGAGDDAEALRGLVEALEAQAGRHAAAELVPALARLAALGAPDRVELEMRRAELLLDPLERLGESAAAWLGLLRGGGLGGAQAARAATALEQLLERGVDPVRIAQALAPVYAAQGDAHKHVAMLELLAEKLPPSADPRERARLRLDAASLRAERLSDLRGALDAAIAALRAAPDHAEARRRCIDLCTRVGAFSELYSLLVETAARLEGRPEEERALRLRAARLAEEELGSNEDAWAQLRRCRELAPYDAEVLTSLCRVALAGERWEEACDLLLVSARLASEPDRPAILVRLGDTLADRLRSHQAAAGVYRQALELLPEPERPPVLERLAHVLELAGDAAGQVRALEELSRLSGDRAQAARAASETARIRGERLGDRRGAVDAYAAALVNDPEDAAAAGALDALLDDPDREVALAAARVLGPRPAGRRDPRRRARILAVEARAVADPVERALAWRAVAELQACEIGDPAAAFGAMAEAVRAAPEDAPAREALRALAEEGHQAEACAQVYEEVLPSMRGEAALPLLRELGDWAERQLSDRPRAVAALQRARALFPGDLPALMALRRLHRAAGGWAELFEACAEVGARGGAAAERAEAWREAAAVAELRLDDPARAAEAWRRVVEVDPADAEAAAALERLYAQLDRPEDLAWILERRRTAGGERDLEAAFRVAEIRRARLDDPAGALALLSEVVRADPAHAGALESLVALASTPGPIGREALALADGALRRAGDHARRVQVREARLGNVDEPSERARLHAEVRSILEADLSDPAYAFAAARRAVAEGGRAREEALLDLPRLAERAGLLGDLAAAWEEAAAGAAAPQAIDLRRRAARLRERSLGDPAGAAGAWRAVLEAAPEDPEALEALERLLSGASSARERLELARRRARRADGEERVRHLLAAAELEISLGETQAAEASYRSALELDRRCLPALEGLERLYSRERRVAELAPVLQALAESGSLEPARRLEVLTRRALALEQGPEPAQAVAAWAEILAESPLVPAAVAGLERLLALPAARQAAARVLEDVHRASGDARRLVAVLEQRVEQADDSERGPLLAEVAALHGRLGQKPQAFLAKLRQYREALARGGDEPSVRAELERLAAETGSFEELAAALEDALEQGVGGPLGVALRRRLGVLYAERLQDPERALRRLEEAAREAPSDEIFGALARLYRRQNAYRELAEVHRRHAQVVADPTQRKDLLFEVATIMEDHLLDRDGAMEAYRQILAVDPEDPNALRLLGRLLGAAERWDELVAVMEREVALADRRPNFALEAAELRFRMGRIKQQRLGDLEGALQAFQGVLAAAPRHPGALGALEELARATGPAAARSAELLEPIYQQEGEHQKLVEALEARAATQPDAVSRAELLRRVVAVYQGPLKSAEMAFLTSCRALREDPGSMESLDLVAALAEATGSEEEYAALLAECADRAGEAPVRAEYRRRLARLQMRPAGEPARAAEEWQKVLDLVPDDSEALEGLTEIYRSQNTGDLLAQVLRRRLGMEEEPSRRVALLRDLAQVQEERLRDAVGAMSTLRRLLELDARDREALSRLDRLCVRNEKWVELADVLAREAAAADAADDEGAAAAFRFRLAELKETRLLDREGAVALYEDILSAQPDHAEAIARLEALLQRDPGNARAAAALERAYEAGGAWQKYAAVLEVRAADRPDPLERKALFQRLAEVRERRLANPEMAFLSLCRAFREDPVDPEVRAALERLAEATEHYEELAALYEEQLPRLGQSGAAVALRLGELEEEKLADPARAAARYELARKLDPAAAGEALAALDRVYRRLERWSELAEVLSAQAGRETRPEERLALLFRLGQLAEERLNAPDRAVAAYEAIAAADPRHLPALRALERLYEASGRIEDLHANLVAQRRSADAPARERLLPKLAQVASALSRHAEAADLWRELLQSKPRHEPALAALEALLEKQERWQELAEVIRARVQVSADRREVARLNDKLGWLLGTKLGNAAQAIASFKAVLDSDPRNRRALEALRDIYASQGDRESLAGVYRRLIPLQEDAAGVKRIRLDLAGVLLEAGQKQEAVEQAKRALDLEGHTVADLERIGQVFAAAGAAADGIRAAEARAGLLAGEGRTAEAVAAWQAVADLWLKARRPEPAAAALEKALELEPQSQTTFEKLRSIHAQAGNWRAYARATDLFLPRVSDPVERVAMHVELAEIHEKRLGQKEMAFLAWARAFQEDPANQRAAEAMERLAVDTEAFEELATVYEQVAEESKGVVRARLQNALGRLRDERLDDAPGAESAFRKALEADPASGEALDGLTRLFSRRGRTRELAITLEQRMEAAAGLEEKKATLLEMAKLYDGQLKDVEEAVGALRRILELDGGDAAAIEALSAIHRREQRWGDLAGVLARARDLAADEAARVAYQLQIAALYENELEDDEAAIEAYRTVLGSEDRNPEALAGLERLYTKLDRFAELNRVYEKLAEIAVEPRERLRVLGKSAGIWEEKLQNPHKAIERNEQVLSLDGGNLPALKSLERLYRQEEQWEKLIAVLQHHASLTQDRRETVHLEIAVGEVWWKAMQRVDRAEAIFTHALETDPESREAMGALGRLYERSGNWNLALDMMRREARAAAGSKDAVEIHHRMGTIHEEMLLDLPAAKQAYAHALEMEAGHLPSIRALKGIHEREKNRDGYLEMLVAESRYVEDDAEKARLLVELGRIHQEERNDRAAATRAYEEALKRAPDFLPAARPLSEIYQSQGDWPQAERVLDVIVRRLSAEGEAKELCRQSYRLGYVAEKLGNRQKALQSYRRAYELDATYLPALEGLGNLLVQEKQWEEALRIFQAILIHHRDGLTDLEVVETYWQIGEVQAQLGQADRAQKSFEKALEMDKNHEPSRHSLVKLLEAQGDWEGAVQHRQKLAPLLEGKARFDQYLAVGQIARDRLKDPYQALDAFLMAARTDPTDVAVTEALLGLYRETRQGQKAADVLGQLLERPEVQADAARAGQLFQTLGELYRDEIKDPDRALAEFEKALDRNPRLVQAFSAVEAILTAHKRWNDLEQAYVRMIQRLPKGPEAQAPRLALWKTLGELYRRVLQNPEGARMAYEVVLKAEPEDAVALEAYADLSAQKPGEEGKAVEAYRQLLRAGGSAHKAISALVGLHASRQQFDQAYCAAQALAHLLGAASAEELQVVSRLRRFAREQASRKLDDALWRERVFHERVRGPLAEIMRVLALEAGPLFVQTPKELGLNAKRDEIDLAGSMLFFVNMYKYVARTLGLEGLRLFRSGEGGRLLLVSTDPPAIVAGDEMFRERPKKELWFSIAKAMAFARAELRLARLMPHDQLEVVFQAACSLGTSRFVVTADPHLVEKMKHQLEKSLPEKTRTQTLKQLSRMYCDVQHPGDVRAYMDGAELTSNRAGALLAGDMEIVKRMVLAEKAQASKLRDEAKLKDLVLFIVSDDFAALREQLGLSVVVKG
ncbi:MAG TPA: tetratricopeptide repeat protein [Anaeromyxobacteraceae bacterium]|nr:tetratricopeptide repeat protein [Anaeromyxobacteraceae bacterium]